VDNVVDMNRLIDDFCVSLEYNEGRSDRTVVKYRGHIRALARFIKEKSLTLESIGTSDREAFTGLYMHEKGMAPRSRRAVVAAVKKFFRWLERQGHVAGNPAAGIPYPYAGLPLPVQMEAHHAERLLMAPGIKDFIGRRDTAILSVFIGCGLRVSGVVALNVSHLLFYPGAYGACDFGIVIPLLPSVEVSTKLGQLQFRNDTPTRSMERLR
jgi:integrase/recombinase XerD